DLVFQSVKNGCPMRDNNILCRYIKPAARKLGMPRVNWRCLRTSYATLMNASGANPKALQAQLGHANIKTTMDIYVQPVEETQHQAVARMEAMYKTRTAKPAEQAQAPQPLNGARYWSTWSSTAVRSMLQ